MADPFIVSLDVGTSSVRALLFDSAARPMEGYGAHLDYRIRTTPDGGAEIDPDELAGLAIDCLDEVHRKAYQDGFPIAAVSASSFWHSLCGVGADGRPTVPLLHLLDTRSAGEVARVPDAHARTGCVPHSSYWPAKLLWLEKSLPEQFRGTSRWLSFPEYLFEKLFGRPRVSTSMVSATGLWNQMENDYDQETLAALPIRREQLAEPAAMDQPESELIPEYQRSWAAFEGVPWFPAWGDGAMNHLGSGCVRSDQFSLMVGTTGAIRASIAPPLGEIPGGLWCYRIDRERALMGGALSNGGDVFAWLKRTLVFPKNLEALLEAAIPGSHGLTVLPFLAGERSPYWRADLRGVIAGISLATEPFHIVQASLESVALRFREIYAILTARVGAPAEVIASGGALLRSPGWTQMIADSLGRSLIASTEPEASSRGAALCALERLGRSAPAASLGAEFCPRTEYAPVYERLQTEQQTLFAKLFK